MSFLQNIQLFDLKVYNQKIKDFLKGSGAAFEFFLDNGYCRKVLGLSHNDMVKQNWINSGWTDFIKWYKGGWKRFFLYKGNFVYRGITNYNISSIKGIIKYGTDRNKDDKSLIIPKWVIKKYGDDPTKWLWATSNIGAWGAANANLGGQNGVRAIIIYNADLLKRDSHDPCVFTLAPGVSSFKDALHGIIRVRFI